MKVGIRYEVTGHPVCDLISRISLYKTKPFLLCEFSTEPFQICLSGLQGADPFPLPLSDGDKPYQIYVKQRSCADVNSSYSISENAELQ
jgi:hypothetical protein